MYLWERRLQMSNPYLPPGTTDQMLDDHMRGDENYMQYKVDFKITLRQGMDPDFIKHLIYTQLEDGEEVEEFGWEEL